ncbi:MAG TPA: glutathione S-transferase N-terminal domain-containing protein [Gaiellaceae bacterium]|jgi:glutathione S-transferase
MAVKLHRCRNLWVKVGGHPCWRVQKALDEAGVAYEVVPGPVRRSKRDSMESHTGQRLYPAIEFENGTWYREQSADMARTIRDGRLMEKSG